MERLNIGQNNNNIREKYKIYATIGRGTFARVKRGKNR